MITYQEEQENKEEKLAAARLRLKQFKKESAKYKNNSNGSSTSPSNPPNQQHQHQQEQQTQDQSNRSSPVSTYSTSSNQTRQIQPFPTMNNMLIDTNLNQAHFKEQLQLHVQTIGILVAEKAELQSKLQQQVKKSDKKQEECDELMGRLKASRQKISDLERLIQQLSNQQNEINEANNNNNINQTNENTKRLINEINSKDMLINELRMRLDETNEKLNLKQHETKNLAQLTLDLKSQLEILQLKMNQFTNQSTDESIKNETNHLTLNSNLNEIDILKKENFDLKMKLDDVFRNLDKQKLDLKADYEMYVEKLQKQIENLVDQINRMTDEREESFSKIDRLESLLKEHKQKNTQLTTDIEHLTQKLNEKENLNSIKLDHSEYRSKVDLLENEIKYFKQQIDILLHEQNSFKSIIDDKEQSILNLNKLLENYESDREKFNSLLEQTHNDKQTISRILKQNNEIKNQLTELQDAYVNLTNTNLELTNQLQAEQFKVKNFESQLESKQTVNNNNSSNKREDADADWDEDEQVVQETSEENLNDNKHTSKETLLDSIKKRLDDLEKENKDLNDYILLMNQQKLNDDNSNSTANFNEEYINNMKLVEDKFKKVMLENADLKEKNQELEHVVQQLQFETETIVDYITMYQMERSKLNDKYKLKDEAIQSLSTQLQVNKLALFEVNNYLNAFIKLYEKQETNNENETDESETSQKKEHILIQIQNLLKNLTQSSSKTLNTISKESLVNQENSSLPLYKPVNNNINSTGIIDEKSIAKFRTETVLCSNCYGDLFVI